MTEKQILTDDEQALFKQVAEVCGLELATPSHYVTDDSPSQDVLKELADFGVEALGTYNSITGIVTLHSECCAPTAKEFKVSAQDVELIVLAHEWAHMIQHQGKHPDVPVAWEDFPKLPQGLGTDAEDLAEKATFMVLHGVPGGKRLQELQAQLAKVSPPEYKKWLADYASWLANGVPPDAAVNDLQNTMRLVRNAGKKGTLKNIENFDE